MNFATPSTPKPVRFMNSHPSSPLARKRLHLDEDARFLHFMPTLSSPFSQPLPALPLTPYRFTPQSDINTVIETDIEAIPQPIEISSADRAAHTKKMLQADSHEKRKVYVSREQDDKATKDNYGRHIRAYQLWWDQIYQPAVIVSDPTRDVIPAFPVTAAKAIMFLDYEASRPKVGSLALIT